MINLRIQFPLLLIFLIVWLYHPSDATIALPTDTTIVERCGTNAFVCGTAIDNGAPNTVVIMIMLSSSCIQNNIYLLSIVISGGICCCFFGYIPSSNCSCQPQGPNIFSIFHANNNCVSFINYSLNWIYI